ncbi:hypothetical protein MPLA_870025 [Mesorhizobium sp. ORS 3359]|nr:hypothetical protein MPLA_870025 [Mesorhizobium sp. ORS 3359]
MVCSGGPSEDFLTANANHQIGIAGVPFALSRLSTAKERHVCLSIKETQASAPVADDKKALIRIPGLRA